MQTAAVVPAPSHAAPPGLANGHGQTNGGGFEAGGHAYANDVAGRGVANGQLHFVPAAGGAAGKFQNSVPLSNGAAAAAAATTRFRQIAPAGKPPLPPFGQAPTRDGNAHGSESWAGPGIAPSAAVRNPDYAAVYQANAASHPVRLGTKRPWSALA